MLGTVRFYFYNFPNDSATTDRHMRVGTGVGETLGTSSPLRQLLPRHPAKSAHPLKHPSQLSNSQWMNFTYDFTYGREQIILAGKWYHSH